MPTEELWEVFAAGTIQWFKAKTLWKHDQDSTIKHLCYPCNQEAL